MIQILIREPVGLIMPFLSSEAFDALEPADLTSYHNYLRSLSRYKEDLTSAERDQLALGLDRVGKRRIKLGLV
jgi:hypothetical protein